MIKHLNLEIYSRGTDPYFSRTLKHRANSLGLKGFFESKEDGSLYIELEGEEENLKRFVLEYEKGDESKNVIRVEPTFTDDYKGYEGFEVKE